MRGFLWVASLAAVLTACSDTGTNSGQDSRVDEKPAPTVFDPMTSTMDRAAAVDGINMDRKDELDGAIDGSD